MVLLWIVCGILALWMLKYIFLISKRLILLSKIKKHAKENYCKLQYMRHPLYSVFRHDAQPDLCIHLKDKTVFVTVITTPFRRIRYHFIQNETLELVHERRGTFMTNPRRPNPTATVDRRYVIRRYPMVFSNEASDPHALHYVILHPAPYSATKAEGSQIQLLHDNDVLFGNVRVCGLRYFLKNLD